MALRGVAGVASVAKRRPHTKLAQNRGLTPAPHPPFMKVQTYARVDLALASPCCTLRP